MTAAAAARRGVQALVAAAACAIACSAQGPPAPTSSAAPKSPSSTASGASAPAAPSATPAPAPPPRATVSPARAAVVLFPNGPPPGCDSATPAYVRCLIGLKFDTHADEGRLALALFDELGDVIGVEREHDMDGGFRGTLHIVPELPVDRHRRHLQWVVEGQRDIAKFIASLEERAGKPVRFRHRALAWRFMRSVGRTTPSAYAADWEVGYNVSGSLHGSAEMVRDTIFHEVFHLNDQAHGVWSRRVLGPWVDAIDAKCNNRTACLAPYAPFKTMVRGGTYYAFQRNNGDIAHEYSAELATRYFEEQRAAARGDKTFPGGWFKCGPEENGRAMRALAEEFFGGVDWVPACERR